MVQALERSRQMTVIMFPQEREEQLIGPLRMLRARIPVRGWFTTPNLDTGSFVGSVRVLRVPSRRSGPWRPGVVAGTLYDASGSRVGSASRRCHLPIEVSWDGGGRLSIGPLEADLLGLRVTVDRVVLWSEVSGTSAAAEEPGGAAAVLGVGPGAGEDRRVVPLRRRA
jgi:hypothetical protein